eukprot:CCRYP_019479-RC/>CCRYP_019479-RC protein AED:0.04 eAED:0.04 QI:278/1/1/1/1/0.85/7/1325/805
MKRNQMMTFPLHHQQSQRRSRPRCFDLRVAKEAKKVPSRPTSRPNHSSMERCISRKRRRNDTARPLFLPVMMFASSLPFTKASSDSFASSRRSNLRARHLLSSSSCLESSEAISPYLPAFSYQPGDKAALSGLIYECKPFPFNGWCGDYEPGNANKPWGDAWILLGECQEGPAAAGGEAVTEVEQGVVNLSASGGNGNGNADLPPCSTYEPYSTEEVYVASDILTSHGHIYKCQLPPADAWCSLVGYEPGIGMYWNMAWEDVGECFQDAPEIGANNNNGPSNNAAYDASASSSSMTYSTQQQPCAPLYSSSGTYSTQSIISYDQHNYVCNVPIWCNQVEYAPGDGNTMSAAAWWKEEQECFGVVTAVPTAFPSASPLASSDHPTQSPTLELGWVNLSNEVAVVPVVGTEQDGLQALAFLVDPQEDQAAPIRTKKPSSSPIQVSNLPPCAPLFTQGHIYELKELISFQNYNYQCEVTTMCNDVQYAPRSGEENQGIAWWKLEECWGEATRHPTPRPTPQLDALPAKQPSAPSKVDIARRAYYASLIPQPILDVLEDNKVSIQKNILVSQAPDFTWEYSTLYTYEDFIVALGVMTEHTLSTSPFFLGGFGTQSNQEAVLYGLVNVAAFLSQSMAESIKYDTCDEANWDFINNYYPLSNACGQGGQSYQDLHCKDDERHMECPVRKDMMLTATTHAKWLGGADGAPGPLYCAPKTSDQPYTGVWDHLYKCNRPQEDPPEFCDVYEGQQAGRYDNSFPAGNSASRSDVEGCCWWGRGVIQVRGVCDIGKINHFLGKGAENSPYPNVNFW